MYPQGFVKPYAPLGLHNTPGLHDTLGSLAKFLNRGFILASEEAFGHVTSHFRSLSEPGDHLAEPGYLRQQ